MISRSSVPAAVLVVLGISCAQAAVPAQGSARIAQAGARAGAQSDGRAIVADPFRDQIFPYLSDGNGWSTNFVFTNLDRHSIVVHLEFSADDGSFLRLPVNGIGTTDAVDITIATGGSFSLRTAGAAANRTTGYAFTEAKNLTDLYSGYAVVRNVANGLPDLEFTVPLAPIDENFFTLAFDNTNGYATFAALINSSVDKDANVVATIQDQDGNVLSTDRITVAPFGRFQFNLADRYPQADKIVGTIAFSASGTQFVTGIGLRSGPNQSLTVIPPFSLKAKP